MKTRVSLKSADVHCVQKKRPKYFFLISSTKLGRFSLYLVGSFLNKFAAVSLNGSYLALLLTLPCEA